MSLRSAIDDVTEALEALQGVVGDLQVTGFWNDNPTPPSLDVYPGTPSQTGRAFGVAEKWLYLTVRARVLAADVEAGQGLLIRLLDPSDAASVEAALQEVATVVEDGVSGFTQYADDGPGVERMLGCEWRVEVAA